MFLIRISLLFFLTVLSSLHSTCQTPFSTADLNDTNLFFGTWQGSLYFKSSADKLDIEMSTWRDSISRQVMVTVINKQTDRARTYPSAFGISSLSLPYTVARLDGSNDSCKGVFLISLVDEAHLSGAFTGSETGCVAVEIKAQRVVQKDVVPVNNNAPVAAGEAKKAETKITATKDPSKPAAGGRAVQDLKPVGSGKIQWIDWTNFPVAQKNKLKTFYTSESQTLYEEITESLTNRCSVKIAVYDLDQDGVEGYLLYKYGCSFFCGTGGCALAAYEKSGKKKLYMLVQEEDLGSIRPGKSGLFTAKSILIQLK